MEENKSGTMKIVTPIAALIIGAIMGFIVGAGQPSSEVAHLQAQIESAKKFFPSIPEMRSVSGTIKNISGDTVTIESANAANPFEVLPAERTITITSDTKITSLDQKDQAMFQKEMAEFSKTAMAPRAGDTMVMPPMPFTEKNIKLSDLKVGMTISAEASENIKEKASFVAVKITASTAMMPVMPPAPLAI